MNKLSILYGTLNSMGLKKEADMISELFFIKNAFVNNAKIKISVSAYNISANLIGDLQSGNSVSFGACYALNLSDRMIINSSPGTSAWEFHRNMNSAYQGLGYMNDLLTSVISQVQNNVGIAFNGIGRSYGSTVSKDAMNHTLNKLGKNLVKTPVIVIFKPSSDLFYIFEAEEKEDIISMIEEEYEIELSEEKISMVMELFSTPYNSLDISLVTGIHSDYFDYIHSAFKITATSDVTSIPKSISYPDDGAIEEDSEYRVLIKKRSEINNGLRNLFDEYRKFLKEIFGPITNKDLGPLYEEFVDYFFNNIQELPSDDYVKSIAGEAAVEHYNHKKDAIKSFKDKCLEILMAEKDVNKELDNFDKKMKDIKSESIDRDNYVLSIRGKK